MSITRSYRVYIIREDNPLGSIGMAEQPIQGAPVFGNLQPVNPINQPNNVMPQHVQPNQQNVMPQHAPPNQLNQQGVPNRDGTIPNQQPAPPIWKPASNFLRRYIMSDEKQDRSSELKKYIQESLVQLRVGLDDLNSKHSKSIVGTQENINLTAHINYCNGKVEVLQRYV